MSKIEHKLFHLGLIEHKLENLPKNFRSCTISKYKILATELLTSIQADLIELEETISESYLIRINGKTNQCFSAIEFLINNYQTSNLNESHKTDKMAHFDIKTATSLVQIYNGSPENLDIFIDSVNLLKEITPTDQMVMLVKFIKTRITGKARIGLPPEIGKVDEIIENIKSRCEEKTNPEKVINQLKTIQTSQTTKICEEVEILTCKLKGLYLEQKIPEKVANDMAVKVGVDTLVDKINNSETKILLKVGQYSTISAATQKVLENETSSKSSAQILSFQRNNRYQRFSSNNYSRFPNNRFNTRFQANRNFRSNNRFSSNTNTYRNNQNTYTPIRNINNNSNLNRNPRQSIQNRRQNTQSNNQRERRIFTAETEEEGVNNFLDQSRQD